MNNRGIVDKLTQNARSAQLVWVYERQAFDTTLTRLTQNTWSAELVRVCECQPFDTPLFLKSLALTFITHYLYCVKRTTEAIYMRLAWTSNPYMNDAGMPQHPLHFLKTITEATSTLAGGFSLSFLIQKHSKSLRNV